ncbi:MAG: hypothetical protein QNI90_03795 [Dinoroseobacter sp.]|nr:hypothetical protein [Dinoroseobacter sp.]
MPFHNLDISFPKHMGLIAHLRRERPVFDEICRDYETLLSDAKDLVDSDDAQWHATLEETLGALRREIATALEDHAAAQAAHQNDPFENMSKNGDRHAL